MNKTILTLCCALLIVGSTMQVATAQMHLKRAVIADGGGTSTNGPTKMNSTIGQPVVGTATNGPTRGRFGYWSGTLPGPTAVWQESAGIIQSLVLGPNPASANVNINVTLSQSGFLDVYLFDASGKLVTAIYSGQREAGSSIVKLDTRSFASGTYFVSARTANALLQTQLIIVK